MALQSSTAIHLDVLFSLSPANCNVGDNPTVDRQGPTDDPGERDGNIRKFALDIRRQVHAGYLQHGRRDCDERSPHRLRLTTRSGEEPLAASWPSRGR